MVQQYLRASKCLLNLVNDSVLSFFYLLPHTVSTLDPKIPTMLSPPSIIHVPMGPFCLQEFPRGICNMTPVYRLCMSRTKISPLCYNGDTAHDTLLNRTYQYIELAGQ